MATVITIEQYLHTVYRPDRDYVNGRAVRRHTGEWNHSHAMTALGCYLHGLEKHLGIWAVMLLRLRVCHDRIRIAEVCAFNSKPNEDVPSTPPFLCGEVVARQGTLQSICERIDDYFAMGVPYVWVVDPQTRRGYEATPATGLREVKSGVLRTENPALEVPLSEIFE